LERRIGKRCCGDCGVAGARRLRDGGRGRGNGAIKLPRYVSGDVAGQVARDVTHHSTDNVTVLNGEVGAVRPHRHGFTRRDRHTCTRSGRVSDHCRVVDGGRVTAGVVDGGTGASSFTSGSLIKGNGTSALSVASASDIVTAIGSTAVTNATNADTVTTVTTNQVIGATAGATAGAVGTYMLAVYSGATTKDFGDTAPGSELRPANATGNNVGSYQTGTWRCMGYTITSSTSSNLTTLWLRIS